MSRDYHSSQAAKELREKAERILGEKDAEVTVTDRQDFVRLVHELEVHQVELELQNEELRRAQIELEASRDRFADLYESAPVAYVTMNPKGLIERANRAARELLGWDRTLEGRPFSSLVHRDDLSAYYDYFNKAAWQNPPADSVEVRLAPCGQKNDEPAYVLIEASPNPDADAEEIRWRLALLDITMRKRAQQELEVLAASLEEKVQQRTAEIEKSEAKARRLAERLVHLLEEDRRQLAVLLHDEVGQELAGMKMQVEDLKRDLDSEVPALADRLEGPVQAIASAISSLRDISSELRPSSLDLLGLVPALRTLAARAQTEACRVRCFFHRMPESLGRDLDLAIFRIAQEALANALRHAGCREIDLNLTREDHGVRLTIEDNGCGFVPDEAVSKISGEGPLGLIIMQEHAVFAGGSLYVDSRPGKGTLVLAEFPLAASSTEKTRSQRTPHRKE